MTPLSDIEAIHSDSQPRPGVLFERQETIGQVLRVVETLPKNQREVIYLKFQCDLSYKEISDITKLSTGNIGFLIHTAIQSIPEANSDGRSGKEGSMIDSTRRSEMDPRSFSANFKALS